MGYYINPPVGTKEEWLNNFVLAIIGSLFKGATK